ncbi:hypothetical protein [Frigidibacter sp. MR17.24]|uniref:hypothetical protein n=1 Tax=Frigidibacter sp. MR17.24 TaxID=3127345 RepID=UPI0030130FA1
MTKKKIFVPKPNDALMAQLQGVVSRAQQGAERDAGNWAKARAAYGQLVCQILDELSQDTRSELCGALATAATASQRRLLSLHTSWVEPVVASADAQGASPGVNSVATKGETQ